MDLNPNVGNVLKALGATAGAGILGFGAYKAVEHFKGGQEAGNSDQAVTSDNVTEDNSETSSEQVTSSDQASASFTEINAVSLDEYPSYLTSAFPYLTIREGSVFDYESNNYMLIEGTDTKFDDNHRPQAILSILNEEGNYDMVSSVTVSGDKVNYNHKNGNVYIATKNGDSIKAFSGQGNNEQLDNFNDDFVIAL